MPLPRVGSGGSSRARRSWVSLALEESGGIAVGKRSEVFDVIGWGRSTQPTGLFIQPVCRARNGGQCPPYDTRYSLGRSRKEWWAVPTLQLPRKAKAGARCAPYL